VARTLYVASTNPGKLRDFALAAGRHGILILPLPGLDTIAAPAEDGLTFEDNARDKAIYYSGFLPGELVLADDSGLEVDFLGGAPGVRSARYAADAGFRTANATDANNNLFLLQQLAPAAGDQRGARYRCALALAKEGATVLTAEGMVEGHGAAVVSDMIPSFIFLAWNAPWRRLTTKPDGRTATAERPFVPC
jgi:XTP/dITP diphosphohydrolase